ncbi:MAG TPA: substrate-binding domain-containing protein [Actinophytocola sp.]|uniref:substrate-binding domain-containing protein n=1 Tax=Actinophytocola sp. TaxID=1872138 RepID=UPI002DB5C13B|nr:substrate-binding domain-containing protein [Actinophytocola sp.]HEU5469542.1 substrate-binding domain-containing protein [Actinophytocola sp.]
MTDRLTIGLVTARIHLGVGATLWSGVLESARRHDINLICFPGGEVRTTGGPANSIYDLVAPDLLDGLICWTSTLGLTAGHERTTRLARRFGRLPMVSVNGTIGEDDHPLTLDSYHGTANAIGHLIEVHGRRRLAFIRGPVANPVSVERYRAYVDTLARHRIPLDRKLVSAPVDFVREAGATAMRVLLDARGLRPGTDFDAVVASSDFLAVDALRVLAERGIGVPHDVSVIGVNDSPEARLSDPPLTSVSMPFAELGALAVESLLCRMGRLSGVRRPAPASSLVIRRSCGCPDALTADRDDVAPARVAGPPLEELCTALRRSIAGDGTEFLGEIDRMVRAAVLGSHETDAWDAALLDLRRQFLPELTGAPRARAERMLGTARLIVADAGRRRLEYERWHAEQTARRLRELGNALSSVVDVPALTEVLDRQLPGLGITHWHLALGSPATLDGALPAGRRFAMVAEPFSVNDELFGLGLFEVGPQDGAVHRAVADQISAALKEIKLFGAVRDARDAAEKANRIKTTLLSSVSDELRTPVEGILRQVAMALESVESLSSAPAGLTDRLKEINVSAEHQLGVISDLLDLTRAELDTLDLSAELVDPRALIEDVFRTRLPHRLPLILADRRRLRQALVTLLGSADRLAADTGRVSVAADVQLPNLRIRVSCTDGESPQEEPEADGRGLGLPITRRLLTLHNGALRFEPRPDGGTFQVSLPLPTPDGQPGTGRPVDPLLLAGGARAAHEAAVLGRRLGLPVRQLHAGTDGILEEHRPAAVVWDLADTSPEDWSVVRHLHEHPRLRRTPFLVFGTSRARDLAEAIRWARPAESAGPIVIADPDPEIQSWYRRLATQARPGHLVLAAGDGTTALSLLGQEVPSLLVVAHELPDMDGLDVLDRLHGGPDVPALVLSSGALSTHDVARAEPHPRAVLLGKGILSEAETVELFGRLLNPGNPVPHRGSLLIRHALAYLHQHYHHQITRRQVAKAAGMSEDYLSRLFHRELGLSPWDYLNRLRIEQAKERLRDSDESIQVVARRVGFHDRAYFSRIFRKLTGVPPQAFREHAHGQ